MQGRAQEQLAYSHEHQHHLQGPVSATTNSSSENEKFPAPFPSTNNGDNSYSHLTQISATAPGSQRSPFATQPSFLPPQLPRRTKSHVASACVNCKRHIWPVMVRSGIFNEYFLLPIGSPTQFLFYFLVLARNLVFRWEEHLVFFFRTRGLGVTYFVVLLAVAFRRTLFSGRVLPFQAQSEIEIESESCPRDIGGYPMCSSDN